MPCLWIHTHSCGTHRGVEWHPHNCVLIVDTRIDKAIINILPLTRGILILCGKTRCPMPHPRRIGIVTITASLECDPSDLGWGIHLHFIPFCTISWGTSFWVPTSTTVQYTLLWVPIGVIVCVPPRRRRTLPRWNIEELER